MRQPLLVHFVESLKRLAEEGLGPTRGRARLVRVEPLGQGGAPVVLDLAPDPELVRAVRVRFLTPTELKWRGTLAAQPEFPALFARIRDRLSSLAALYGRKPLEIDFKALGERAGRVIMVRSRMAHVSVTRRSSKTGQTHPIGGFTGEAEYRGELAEFVPYLRAAAWTGVGRQTVWGNGVIEVHPVKSAD